jgi:hypothetical protein
MTLCNKTEEVCSECNAIPVLRQALYVSNLIITERNISNFIIIYSKSNCFIRSNDNSNFMDGGKYSY